MRPDFNWLPGGTPALAFQLSVPGRIIFSCPVDADCNDTETFYAGLEDRQIDRAWPSFQERIGKLVAEYDAFMGSKANHSSGLIETEASVHGFLLARGCATIVYAHRDHI